MNDFGMQKSVFYDTLYGGHKSDAGVGSGRRRQFLDLYGFRFSTTLRNVCVIELSDSVVFSVAKTVFLKFDVHCAYCSAHKFSPLIFLYTTLSEVEFWKVWVSLG
jgi:hypothetical protein